MQILNVRIQLEKSQWAEKFLASFTNILNNLELARHKSTSRKFVMIWIQFFHHQSLNPIHASYHYLLQLIASLNCSSHWKIISNRLHCVHQFSEISLRLRSNFWLWMELIYLSACFSTKLLGVQKCIDLIQYRSDRISVIMNFD